MNKSQLRILAREYAQGRLEADDYRAQRAMLLDGISAGQIAIEREVPPAPSPPPPSPPDTIAPVDAEEDPPAFRLPRFVPAIVGVMVVALLAWGLWPAGDEPPSIDPDSTTQAPLPPRQVSEARILVESFAAARDWSDTSIGTFRREWQALSEAGRNEAVSAHWFRRLTGALREEVKTQLALAEFDQTGAASAKVKRLVALGEFLGVADRLPAGEIPRAAAPETEAPPTPTGTPVATVEITPVPETIAAAPAPTPATVSTPQTARAVAAAAAGGGSDWLAGQDGDAYTLQLFAVNRIEKIERIVADHPGLGLRILTSSGGEPRYRVVWGTFGSPERARAAHPDLPADIRNAQPTPFVKGFAELRADLTKPAQPPPGAGANRYTLQLFASDNRQSAERLVTAYPGLALRLHPTTDPGSPYRVLYGDFADEAAARAAIGRLPTDLVERAGKPLVKPLADLEAIAARRQ